MIDIEDAPVFCENTRVDIELVAKLMKLAGLSSSNSGIIKGINNNLSSSQSAYQRKINSQILIYKETQPMMRNGQQRRSFHSPRQFLGLIKASDLFRLAIFSTGGNDSSTIITTIGELIRTKQIRLEKTEIRVDIHDNLVDVYRKMTLHGESKAIVCECLKECGYVKIRDIQQQLLAQYFPHFSSPSLAQVPLHPYLNQRMSFNEIS